MPVLLELSLHLECKLLVGLHQLSHGCNLLINITTHNADLLIWVARELNGNLLECTQLLLRALALQPV